MAQQQGGESSTEGRLGGELGTAVVAGDFALGAGWGSTASVAVAAGSNDQRGKITVTSAGTGQAQATATVLLTFHDGTYAGANPPFVIWQLVDNTNAVTEAQPTAYVSTLTTTGFTHAVLPVAAKTYTFVYVCIA